MNKRTFFIISLLLLTSLGLQADPVPPSSPPLPNKNVTPTARTCPQMNGIYFTGDFIYWKVRQEELIYAAHTDFVFAPTSRNIKVETVEIDFDYDPGFKLGLGGNLPFDGWDLYLNWTHLHNTAHSSVSSSIGDLINTENLGGGGIPFLAEHASATLNIMFNSLDFDWGRRFYLSETFTVRPSFGAKAVWVRQRLRSDFKDVSSLPFPPGTPNAQRFPGNPEVYKAKISFSGVGPYFAINGKWEWIWGLGIYGELSGALLWGRFKQTGHTFNNDLEFSGGGGGTVTIIDQTTNTSYAGYRIRPTVQAFIGLDWERCIIAKWLALDFRLGYEVQYFFSQIVNVSQGVEESDLTFDGLTFTGRLDF